MQPEHNVKQHQRLEKITEENDQQLNLGSEELNKLLAEAKTTILDLQLDLKAFNEKVANLQRQNDQYARELAELKTTADMKKAVAVEPTIPMTTIPLEPIVIVDCKTDVQTATNTKVKRNRAQSKAKASDERRSNAETNSSDEDDSSEDVDTYVM